MRLIRQVVMADESGCKVTMAVWGEYARKIDLSPDEHPVLAIKRVTTCEYMVGYFLGSNHQLKLGQHLPIRSETP
jgi:hypothetical protein